MANRPFKEMMHKLIIEKNIICKRGIIVSPQTLRRDILMNVHDDIHCSVTVTQRKLKL